MNFEYFTYKPYFAEAVEIAANDRQFCVFCGGRKHFYKVVDDPEFTYKIQKTQVKANGGARGLLSWIDKWSHHGETSESLIDIFLRQLLENCKEC